MDITVPGNYNILTTVVKKEFEKGITEAKPLFKGVYETVGSATASTVQTWLGHAPGMREWKEGESRIMRNVQSYQYAITNRKFEDTISIPVVAIEDDQYGIYANRSKYMGAAAATIGDQLIASLFNDGFTTALGYDALPWFSASHTVGLSTVNNLGTAPLSTASFETAYKTLRSYKVQPDKDSTARPLNPSIGTPILVVPPILEFTANTIVNSEYLGTNAASIQRISNPYFKRATVLVVPWLTSDTAWFLLNVDGMTPIFLQERTKLAFKEWTPITGQQAFERDEIVYGCRWRGVAYPTHPWLAYGSTGAAT